MKVLFVGCGMVGADAATQLAAGFPELDIVVADYHKEVAEKLASQIGGKTRGIQLDLHDADGLKAAMDGVGLVMNAAGPFFRNAAPVMEAAIAAKADYLDINDDHDVALRVIQDTEFRQRAQAAGIRMVIGCGSTPGLTNVIARHSIDQLDTADTVRMAMVLSMSNQFSPAVLDHMFHITAHKVTQFLDGEYREVQGYTEKRQIDCIAPFNSYPAYYAGHGEPIMLPSSFPSLRNVTAHLAFFPDQAATAWRTLIEMGFAEKTVIDGLGITPARYLAGHLSANLGANYLTPDVGHEPQGYCVHLEVEGAIGDKRQIIKTELQGILNPDLSPEEDPANSDPTSLCARIGMEEILAGRVIGTGVLFPETCFDPDRFIKRFIDQSGLFLKQEIKTTSPTIF